MILVYKNTKVFYEILGETGEFVVFLHGWGSGSEVLIPLAKEFKNNRVLLIDFPPFSCSEEPKEPWHLTDYVNLTYQIFVENNIKTAKIISHSFGGRVAICLAEKYNIVKSLILMSSAGIKMRKSFKTKLKILTYKLQKKLGKIPQNAGSKDYQKLSPVMKQTFVNIVNENLEETAKKINCKTTLIYGTKDTETPPYMARKLHKLIKGSKLIFVKNAKHFVWLKDIESVKKLLKN